MSVSPRRVARNRVGDSVSSVPAPTRRVARDGGPRESSGRRRVKPPHPALDDWRFDSRARNREDGNGGPPGRGTRIPGKRTRTRVDHAALVSDIRDGAYFPGVLHIGGSAFVGVRGRARGDLRRRSSAGDAVTALALVTRSRAAFRRRRRERVAYEGNAPELRRPGARGGKGVGAWWTRAPTAATDEAEALEIEDETTRRRKKETGGGGNEPKSRGRSIRGTTRRRHSFDSVDVPRYLSFRRTVRTYARAPTRGVLRRLANPLSSLWVTCAECGKWRRLPPGARRPPRARRGTASSRNTYPRANEAARFPRRNRRRRSGRKRRWDVTNRARRHPARSETCVCFWTPSENRASGTRGIAWTTPRGTRGYWWRGCVEAGACEPRTGRRVLWRASDMAQPTRRILAKVLHLLPERQRTADADADVRGMPADSRPADRENARKTPPDEDGDVRARSVWPGTSPVFAKMPARCGRSGGGGVATRGRDVQRVSPSVRRRATRFRRGRRAIRTRGSTTKTRNRRAGRRRTRRRRSRTRRRARRSPPQPRLWVRLERSARWRAGLVLPGSTAFACFSPPPRSSSFPTRRSSNTGSVRLRGTFARLRRDARVLAVGGMCAREASALEATLRARNEASALEAMGDDVVVPGADPPGTHRARDFPPAETLAREYDVVLSTFDRMSQRSKGGNRDDLLRVHFLRLIVDEGHLLGSVGSETTRAQRPRRFAPSDDGS